MLNKRALGLLLVLCCFFNFETSVGEAAQKTSYHAQSVRIDDASQIWIFDNLAQSEELEAMNEYIAFVPKSRFMQQDIDTALEKGITPFHAMVDKTEIPKMRIFPTVKSLLEDAVGREAHLVDVYAEFLHSLDPKPPVQDDCNKDTYHVAIFLNKFWKHNSYGQISFYSNNGQQDGRLEIVHTVHPKPARMVIWPSCVVHAAHPPAVNYFSNLRLLRMKFLADQDQKPGDSRSTDDSENTPKVGFGDFRFTNDDTNRTIDYAKHLKREFYDGAKRGIYVFDDLFTVDELRQFRQHLLDTGSPHLSQYDGEPLEDHDNVQWIASFNVSEFVNTPVWGRVKELLVFLTKEDQWYPYDVALNYVRPADHTRIHPDAEPHQYEYTYLLYLTEDITQDDFGETVFFEQERKKLDGIHQFTRPGGEEFEPFAAVWPKFGRVAIFRNVIEHSARPLSSAHLDCRYSFAVKAARTQRLAYIKKLYESMESVGELNEEQQQLNGQLSLGKHDDPKHSSLSLEALASKLKETEEGAKKFMNTQAAMFMEMMK